ncbi:MAG: hypothetical protein AAFQ57_04080 [Cyanobacteria bacterium J06626_14]
MEFFLAFLVVLSSYVFGSEALDVQVKNPGCDPVIHVCNDE